MKFVDGSSDWQINRGEFLAHFEQRLYNLVLEDMLTNPIKEVIQGDKSAIDYLFPHENSTLSEKEISDILGKFDLDGDDVVTRGEMVRVFQANKEWVARAFVDRIDLVQKNLNLQTK